MAARVGAALGVDVGVRDVFSAPSVGELGTLLDGRDSHVRIPLAPRQRSEPVPLSLAQQRMWFINQYDTTSPAYNIPLAVRLRGPLDATALTDALTDVITRHETLRTHYPDSDDGPHQVVHDPSPLEPIGTVIDVDELQHHLRDVVSREFDVATEVPVDTALFRISPSEHVLALVLHHICADGSSLMPLAHDLMTAYEARVSGRAPTWTPLPVQYGDYTLWQRETLGSEDDPESIISQQIRYWTHTLTNLPEVLELPTDHPAPHNKPSTAPPSTSPSTTTPTTHSPN